MHCRNAELKTSPQGTQTTIEQDLNIKPANAVILSKQPFAQKSIRTKVSLTRATQYQDHSQWEHNLKIVSGNHSHVKETQI